MKNTKIKANINQKIAFWGLAVIGLLSVALFLFGLWRDVKGDYCTGIMGANISCIEYTLSYPFAFIALPLALLLVAVLVINRMSK